MSSDGKSRALEPRTPHRFFRILLEEFREKMPLPKAFVAGIAEPEKWRTATIRSNHEFGRTWQVDVRGDANGLRFTGKAWESFFQACDFVVFSQQGSEAVFSVDAFGCNACLRSYGGHPTLRGQRSCKALVPGNPSRFFTVMLEGFHKRLPLPRAFAAAAAVKGAKWEAATIKSSPLDRSWSVEVRGDAGDLYLAGPAWQSFVQAHDLQIGYFLVFSYEGEAIFTIDHVFDLSTCCKSYTNPSTRVQEEVPTIQSNSNDGKSKETVLFGGKANTRATVEQFEYTINSSTASYLPVDFLKRCAVWRRDRRVLLISNSQAGCRWKVELHHSFDGKCRRVKFGIGWAAFKRAYGLVAGDICVFTLLSSSKRNGAAFSVSKKAGHPTDDKEKKTMSEQRHRTDDNNKKKTVSKEGHRTDNKNKKTVSKEGHRTDNNNNKTVSKEGRHQTDNNNNNTLRSKAGHPIDGMKKKKMLRFRRSVTKEDQFELRMNPSGIAQVPQYFVKRHELRCTDRALFSNSQGSWVVHFYHYRSEGRTRLGAGWLAFKRANGFRVGDICLFQLLSKPKKSGVSFFVTKKGV